MSIIDKFKNTKLISRNNKAVNVFLIRYYNWLVVLIAILIIVVGYFLLIQPKYREINSSKEPDNQNQIEEQPYSKKQAELSKFIELERAYNKISKADKEKIEAILPSKPDVEKLMAEIESIVLKNGLILTSLSIQQTEEKKSNNITAVISGDNSGSKSTDFSEGIGLVRISLSVAGADYVSFKNLLKTIENNIRLMDIKNIKYNGDNSEISLDIIVYYFS